MQAKKISLISSYLLSVSIAILIIGVLFKIMHWPFSGIMILASLISILILNLIRFILNKEKTVLSYLKLIFILSWIFNSTTIFYIPWYEQPLYKMLAWGSLIAWLITYMYESIFAKGEDERPLADRISDLIIFIASVVVAIGVIFKILHWPKAGLFLVGGLSTALVWFLYDTFIKSSKNNT